MNRGHVHWRVCVTRHTQSLAKWKSASCRLHSGGGSHRDPLSRLCTSQTYVVLRPTPIPLDQQTPPPPTPVKGK